MPVPQMDWHTPVMAPYRCSSMWGSFAGGSVAQQLTPAKARPTTPTARPAALLALLLPSDCLVLLPAASVVVKWVLHGALSLCLMLGVGRLGVQRCATRCITVVYESFFCIFMTAIRLLLH